MAEFNSKKTLVFSDVASIAIKVIVGLASFQLLAPYIWNYLSELVHFRKIWSFRIISGIYFMLPLYIIIIWWKYAHHQFKILADPQITDERPAGIKEQLQKPLKAFTLLSGAILAFLFVIYFIIIFFPYEPCMMFYLIQIISLAAIIILIIYSDKIVKLNLQLFDDFAPGIKAEAVKFKKFELVFYIFFVIIIAMEFFYLTGKDYLKKNSSCVCETYKIRHRAKLENAFNTIELKASIALSRKKLEDETFKLQLRENLLKLNKYNYSKPENDSLESIFDYNELFEKKSSIKVNNMLGYLYNDSVLSAHYRHAQRNFIAFSHFVDSLNEHFDNPASDLCLNCPPYEIDRMLAINDLGKFASDSLSLKTKLAWFDLTISILKALEQKADKSARKQLAIVIGNIQMKGIFLFFNILVFLSCLYIFLKTNKGILIILSDSPVLTKNPAIKKQTDEGLAYNEIMLSSVWVYLTIIFGLLIPLLKPVNEDKINIDKPFQMLTIPGQIQGESRTYIDDHSTHLSLDSGRTYYFNIDANGDLQHDTIWKDSSGLDDETKRMIKAIHDRVKDMNVKDGDKRNADKIINEFYKK